MMNKNDRKTNTIARNCNKKELFNIIGDFNNNYSSYNEIYLKNLLNLISLYENISLAFECFPSKLKFQKVEYLSLFNGVLQ